MIRSSIAKKAVVAITGLLLFGFVIGHMVGNLQIFLGRETINNYAEFLHSMPELLWVARIGLLVAVALHITFTIWVSKENRESRPQRYVMERTTRASSASRTMLLSGLLVLAFIVYHLLHFTVQVTNPDYQQYYEHHGQPVTLVSFEPTQIGPGQEQADLDAAVEASTPGNDVATEAARAIQEIPADSVAESERREYRRDVYRMVILGFRDPLIALTYIVAQILLGLHLSHGASAMFQTLGLTIPKYRRGLFLVGPVAATIIVLGNVSIPAFILLDYWTKFGYFTI
ncbi:succinate dehydrogenase cytochrome b subunit [Tautonia marina]|uniref:succinate dehydrogenase cytochrome b subunit n=1 Tax=Tautonia marina TaxID=2653855 RepID=UPI0012613ACC|nr:succinate dehydrogenase cytochrome b subunit [Tautonia marina]